VEAGAVFLGRHGRRQDGGEFDWTGWQYSSELSIGANLPEVMRKWGGGDTEIERNAFEFMGEYVISNSAAFPNFSVTFYEWPPYRFAGIKAFATDAGAVGGVYIGRTDREGVKKLLGSPDVIEKEADGELWMWKSEFNGLMIGFGGDGKASLMTYEARAAD
jgi:hypothetical protein